MALQLTKNAASDFSGTKGKPVLLGITAAAPIAANILSVNYNGTTLTAAPFQITLGNGNHGLVVVYIASTEGAPVSIQEIDLANPANTQALANPHFHKSDPSEVILLRVP